MFSLVELNTATLDKGIPGITPVDTALLFLLMFGVAMFPYALFYLSLRQKPSAAPGAAGLTHGPFARLTAWMHLHHAEAMRH